MATTLGAIRSKVRERLVEFYAITAPGKPTATVHGTAGTKTISYKITALNALGETTASQVVTVTTANATLSGSNFIELTWVELDGATSYNVYRTATNGTSPTTTGLIGNTSSLSFNDTGLAGDSSSVPTENTTGVTNPFWSEDELLNIIIDGAKDLWRKIIDLHQNHFTTIDATNVTHAAGLTQLSGVPADCFRVLSIEPRDITENSTGRQVNYKPKKYTSAQFIADRSLGTLTPDYSTSIYYDILNAGSPVAAPTIVVSRILSSTLNIRLTYVHTLDVSAMTEDDSNPIPGESDNALIAWGVAYARAKERDDRMPDPGWLSVYATDAQGLMTALTPRQEQEEEVVEDLFAGQWGY
jgi:hypothetical protein